MTNYSSRQPTILALLLLSLALTASFISCQSVQWEEPNSSGSPLIINCGTYSLPITILASQYFPYPIHLVSNDSRFTWEAGFVIPYEGTYANDIMGCSGNVPAGLYVINFTLDNSSWSGPGLLYIQVSSTPVELEVVPVVTITSGSAAGPTYNLVSLDPYADMTISASISSNAFSVTPSSITYRPNSTSQGFTLSTNGNTVSTSSATVTYTISGTNAAAYALNQTYQVVNVPGGSNTSSTTTASTTTPTTTTTTTPTTTTTTTPTTTTTTTPTTTPTTTTTTTPTTTSTTTTTTTPTTTPTTTTKNITTANTTKSTTTNTSGGVTTSLVSSTSNSTVVAGTYSLPLTLITSASTFTSSVWCTSSTNGFGFNPTLVTSAGSTSTSSYLGASADLSAGTYNVSFWCNDTHYQAPATIKVTVSAGPIKIPLPANVTVNYVPGTSVSSSKITFDLSAYPPWEDIFITPTLPAGDYNWIVSPSQLTLTYAVKTASFVFQTSYTATGNVTSLVTYVVSGSNGASYTIPGTQTIKAVKSKRFLTIDSILGRTGPGSRRL